MISRDAPGPILDAPCGNGRNALPFAERGHDVYCADISDLALKTVAGLQDSRALPGRLIPLKTDLQNPPPLRLSDRKYGAILIVHFVSILFTEWAIGALYPGGFLFLETFGNRGENYRQLPEAGALKRLIQSGCEAIFYREYHAGPPAGDAVTVTLLARKVGDVTGM